MLIRLLTRLLQRVKHAACPSPPVTWLPLSGVTVIRHLPSSHRDRPSGMLIRVGKEQHLLPRHHAHPANWGTCVGVPTTLFVSKAWAQQEGLREDPES